MKHLLCLGDSITDCGRLWDNPPLGNGYVSMLSEKFQQKNTGLRITNCGTDGFTLSRLLEKASHQYLPLNADVITVLIGINDVGIMMNTRRSYSQKIAGMKKFMNNYEEFLNILFSSHVCPQILLMGPFIFPCPEEFRLWIPYVKDMEYGIRQLAEKNALPFLPLHDFLNQKAEAMGYSSVTTDGVHLTSMGHELITDRLFSALELMIA